MKLPNSYRLWTILALILVASVSSSPAAAQAIDADGEVKATGFDGDGSKLTNVDAETLDNLDSTVLARDTEVLPLVLAGDGPGSGLNADLLDGLNSTAFARSATSTSLEAQLACFARTLEGRVFTEVEPNNNAATATPYCLGTGSGRVGGTQEDWWSMPVEIGDLIFSWVDTTFSPFTALPIQDSLLHIYANDGTTLIEFDDDDGTPFLSAVVAGAVAPQAGRIFTRVREGGNSKEITYKLFQVVVNPVDTQAESEPNNSFLNPDIIDSQRIITGNQVFGAILDPDWFQFYAPPGTRINVILDEDPDNDGLPSSVQVNIHDAGGNALLPATGSTAGAANTPPDAEAYGRTSFFGGLYFVSINPAAGGTDTDGDYRFVIQILPTEG